jgi:uncharacterized protein
MNLERDHDMNERAAILSVADEVRGRLAGESSGHDWWHVHRVWKMAEHLAQGSGADARVVQLAALLHDIADWKFHGGDETVGPRVARSLLDKHNLPDEVIDAVCAIIPEISFKGAGVSDEPSTLEGKIVQDADRLDAIGAIGIARAFAYGGYAGQKLHDPDRAPVMHTSKEVYVSSRGTTINHFYEKLLLIKDRLHTPRARQIAEQRHALMELYLHEFLAEWNSVDHASASKTA